MNRVIPTSAAATQRKESEKMKTWNDITHFAGFDWAKDHHDVLVLDGAGKIVTEFRFDHTASGWTLCQEKLAQFPQVAIAVEAGHSAAIERLVTLDYRVYPVHPRSSKSYRTRKLPSGTKTDRADCWALADALRLEGESWRVLTAPEPLVQQLRLLCRDEVALIEQRTALVNQLQQALYEYYPAALEAFNDWCAPSAWAFVERFPTPQSLVQAGKRKWQNFLHAHKLFHPEWNQKRMEIFAKADQFCGAEATIAAKSALAVATVKILQTLEAQLARYRALITECFKQHPDHAPVRVAARRRPQAGSATIGRTGRAQAAGRHAASLAVSGGHGSGQLPVGQSVRGLSAPPMQPVSAGHHSSVGGPQPPLLRLGAHLLRSTSQERTEPRLRACAAWECAGSKSSPP